MKTINFKKILFIITAVLLCVVTVFSAGCSCKKTPKPGEGDNPGTIDDDRRPEPTETGKFILKDGATPYKIVLPQGAVSLETMAADEIQRFFSEATGVEIPVVYDSGLVYAEDAKYISVGHTAPLTSAGIEIDGAKLGSDGYRLVTKGDSVFIAGVSAKSALYGAYDFLHEILGYEFFYEDCYSLHSNVKEVKLMGYNFAEYPDIEDRCMNYGYMDNDTSIYHNMRVRGFNEAFIPVGGKSFHNSLEWIASPPAAVTSDPAYAESAPKWKAPSGQQLCYTARGDAKAYELMQITCLNTLQKALASYPDKKVITLTMEDNHSVCGCASCTALANSYGGALSATVILFCNELNRAIREWFNTPAGAQHDRDLKIIFFAYNEMTKAPSVYNGESGKWEGIKGIKCDPGVGVYYAPISMDYTQSFQHKVNKDFQDITYSWAALADGIWLWLYSTIFPDYLVPYDTFNGMQSYYKMAKEVNARYLFDQAQWDADASTGWSALKAYLNAKLAWNVNADMSALIQGFFDGYFGEASAEMRAFFDSYRVHSEYIKDERNFTNKTDVFGGNASVYISAVKERFFPKGVLQNWMTLIDAALAKIEPLKTSDAALYQALYNRIALERLSVIYLWVSLYDYNTSTNQITDFKILFKADAERTGLNRLKEVAPIEGLWTSWGI